VGYGTQKRGEITAAIASIDAAAIEKIQTSSAMDAMKGQVAGVDVQSNGGRPGQGSTVRIRGRRSPSASNDPLYVIDGIPAIAGASSVQDLNPQDIQSMEILKDAAATAIYGSRGANGVILITTKRGKVGKTIVSYSGYFGTTSATRLVDMMDGEQFADLKRESKRTAWNGTIPADPVVFEDPVELNSIANGLSTDYLDLVLNDGWQTNHQFSVSGGSENTNFSIALGYFNEQGIISNMDYERFTGRINVDHKISKVFKIGMSMSISNSLQNWGSNATMGESLANNPLGIPYDEDGNLLFLPTNDGIRTNPLSELVDGAYIDERKNTRLFIPIYLDINISDNLKFKSIFGPDIRYRRRGEFRGSLTNDNRGGPGDAEVENTNDFGYTVENLLTWDKEIGSRSNLKVTLLQSIQKSREERYYAAVSNIPYESQQFYNMGSASVKGNIESRLEEWTLSSFMGRVNYEIGGKYLFQASLRADGSSRLAADNKWNYFPGASAGWRISQEDFMENVDWISDLKLRGSYGEVGNTSVDPYQTAGRLAGSVYAFGESSALGFGLDEIPNEDLTWEVSKTIDIGIDYSLFNGRLYGSLDWYNTNTTDILLNRGLPYTSGYTNILQNIGATESSGIEFSINGDILNNEDGLSWNVGFNITHYDEKIVELALKDENGNPIDDIGNNWFIGQPLNVFFDYEKIGIYQSNEEALAATMEDKEPGEIKLRDVNGDGVITPDDRLILGNDVPDFYGGLINSFAYRNWDFSFFFYFRQGQMIRDNFHSGNNSLFGRYNNLDVDYWTIDNPTNDSPRPNENQERPRNGGTMSYFDGSFVKLRNVTLGYNFDKSITDKLLMSNLRVYVSGQNLWFISDYDTFDPEVSEEDGDLDASTIPSNKMISFGINITF